MFDIRYHYINYYKNFCLQILRETQSLLFLTVLKLAVFHLLLYAYHRQRLITFAFH